MGKIYNDTNESIDIHSLFLLSAQGSEMIVYNDSDFVYKIFKKDYMIEHKSKEELEYLSSINTSRILMPQANLFSDGNLIGYIMKYIKGEENILVIQY